VGKPEGKRPLGRSKHRPVVNSKMDLGEIRYGEMDLIGLDENMDQWWALVTTIMNLQVTQNGGMFLSSCTTCGLLRRVQHHVDNYLVSNEQTGVNKLYLLIIWVQYSTQPTFVSFKSLQFLKQRFCFTLFMFVGKKFMSEAY
jgi:hypothetical protein